MRKLSHPDRQRLDALTGPFSSKPVSSGRIVQVPPPPTLEMDQIGLPPNCALKIDFTNGLPIGWGRVSIRYETRDSDHPSEPFVVWGNKRCEWKTVNSTEKMAATVREILRGLFQHEVDEWLTIGGKRLVEPNHGYQSVV